MKSHPLSAPHFQVIKLELRRWQCGFSHQLPPQRSRRCREFHHLSSVGFSWKQMDICTPSLPREGEVGRGAKKWGLTRHKPNSGGRFCSVPLCDESFFPGLPKQSAMAWHLTGRLKTIEMYCPIVLQTGNLKPEAAPPEVPRETSSTDPWLSWVSRCLVPGPAFFTRPFPGLSSHAVPLCESASAESPSLLVWTLVILDEGPTWLL